MDGWVSVQTIDARPVAGGPNRIEPSSEIDHRCLNRGEPVSLEVDVKRRAQFYVDKVAGIVGVGERYSVLAVDDAVIPCPVGIVSCVGAKLPTDEDRGHTPTFRLKKTPSRHRGAARW